MPRMNHFTVTARYSLPLLILGIAQSLSAQTTAIVNTTVVPMHTETVLRNHTVVIHGDSIVAVGPHPRVGVPEGATRIDGTGKYLMPGLADLHVHVRQEEDFANYVAHGVTTVLDMGGPAHRLDWRDRIERGELLGPHLLVGFFIDGPGREGSAASAAESARTAIERAAATGYDYIKVYNSLTQGQFDAIMSEADRRDIAVIGHGVRAPGMQGILAAGLAMIAHGEEYIYTFFGNRTDRSRIPEAVRITGESRAYVLPNLSAYEIIGLQWGRPAVVDSLMAVPESRYLHAAHRRNWRGGRYTSRRGDIRPRLVFLKELTLALVEGGVPILLGTDSPGLPGLYAGASIHDDLRNLVDAGLTPYQALQAGTLSAGRFVQNTIQTARPFGVVTVGARADLILLDHNPLASVDAVRNPVGVVLHGTWWSRDALNEVRAALF